MQDKTLLFSTPPGLEEIALEDISEKLPYNESKILRRECNVPGYFVVNWNSKISVDDIMTLRSVMKVYTLIGMKKFKSEVSSLELLNSEIKDFVANFEDYLLSFFASPYTSFAIKVLRKGKHFFTSLDVAKVLGEEIIKLVKIKRGFRPLVNLSFPLLLFFTIITDKCLVLSLDITRQSLHKREYRIYYHPAMLNEVIAYNMCRFAGVKEAKYVLDPMCGSGTLLIEAFYLNPNVKLYGLDINPQHVTGTLNNLRAAGISAEVRVGDATHLEEYFKEKYFDVIITNPPYGIREKDNIPRLYLRFFNSAKKVLKEDGILCIITPHLKTSLKLLSKTSFKVVEWRQILYGGLKLYIIKSSN